MWLSEDFFAPKLAAWFVTPIVSAMVEQIWRRKMSKKPCTFHWTFENFSQSESRKNNRKVFEGASMEPINKLKRCHRLSYAIDDYANDGALGVV